MGKLKNLMSHPLLSLDRRLESPAFYRLSDETFLRLRYFFRMKKGLNLKNPRTFNEKLQYLKLHDRQPRLTEMADKYRSKQLAAEVLGEDYVIPTLGCWEHFQDIDFDSLPDRFVLKTTHDSGGVVICRDKASFDFQKAEQKLEAHLKVNYYYHGREWPYKNVPPRILAEEYVENPGQESLVVYKVFNFMGTPRIIQVIQGDKTEHESIDYFDRDWNLLQLRQNFPNSREHLEKPRVLEEMLTLSGKLSQGMPFLRTDWYIVGGKLKFSEFTFYSDAGFAAFTPQSWDLELGSRIDLSALQ